MIHQLPKLPFAYDALEPFIDRQTMEIHHQKHHQAYVDKLNAALEKYPALQGRPVEELLVDLPKLDVAEPDRMAIKNQAGGVHNHNLFWTYLDPKNTKDEMLTTEITGIFGSVDNFKQQFSDSATKLFGSGWTWLVRDGKNSKLLIENYLNQDSPLTAGMQPIFGLDVWEHAYYLKYQNRRAEYIGNWWNVLKLI